MGLKIHLAAVIANHQIGMMVFLVGHPGHSIDKSNGLIVVLELKFPANSLEVGFKRQRG